MKQLLITGAGSGLGAALAKQYAMSGYHVLLLGRSIERLQKTKSEVEQLGGTASIFVCDIANAEEVEQTVMTITKNFPSLMGIINNAGVGHFGKLETLSISEINEMIDTNVKGTIFLTAQLLPFLKSKNEAKIMNIISTAGLRGKVNESVYVASKFAVRGFTESLVKELEGTNIAVTAVYMGGMDTPFWDESTHIADKSRLKNAETVAEKIIAEDDGKSEIVIDR